jgi:hypothetical protein
MVKDLPFEEIVESNSKKSIRIFSSHLDDEELKWHWDEEDRIITPLSETDWKFQFDNCLPINIDRSIKVPKGEWHRLIKGTEDLKIQVEKLP